MSKSTKKKAEPAVKFSCPNCWATATSEIFENSENDVVVHCAECGYETHAGDTSPARPQKTRSPLLYPIIKRQAVLQFRQPYALVSVDRLIDLCVVDISVTIGHNCYTESFPENQVWSKRKTNDPAPIGLQTKWLTWLLGHAHLCQEDVDILSAEVEALFNYVQP